jgi:hypothetical protein
MSLNEVEKIILDVVEKVSLGAAESGGVCTFSNYFGREKF